MADQLGGRLFLLTFKNPLNYLLFDPVSTPMVKVFTAYNIFFLVPLLAPFGGALLAALLYKITFEVGIKHSKSDNV